MRQHLGRREREARKLRMKQGKRFYAMSDSDGSITLNLGRKKSLEIGFRNNSSVRLKKKFKGCVVDAER